MRSYTTEKVKKVNNQVVDYETKTVTVKSGKSKFLISGMTEESAKAWGPLFHLFWILSNETKHNENHVLLHPVKRKEIADRMNIKIRSISNYLQRLSGMNMLVIWKGYIYLNPSVF